MRSTLRLNARFLPAIGLLALVMQVLDPSRAWVILLIGLGGTWLFCRWWVLGLARSLKFEREIRYGWAQVGDRLEERFTLTNGFPLPATWVTVQDHSDLPDHHASVATGVDGASSSQWKVHNLCTHRGVFTLGGTTLETGDPLGLYTLTLDDPTSATLAVMPPSVPLPDFQVASNGWSGDGRAQLHALEETLNASQTREMVPNDPLKLIHWKSTARQGKFFVRQFEGRPSGDWWILLDLHQAVQLGEGWDSTEEHAVILAASLARRGLQEEHAVGLAVNGRAPEWIVPRRNENQNRTILKALAVASPGTLSLKAYLERIGQTMGSRSSLIIITADPDPAWTAALVPLIWRGLQPTVFFFDPGTFGGETGVEAVGSALRSAGIISHIIPRELIERRQARPGTEGQWEWRVVGTGKAVAVNAPLDDWRRLG